MSMQLDRARLQQITEAGTVLVGPACHEANAEAGDCAEAARWPDGPRRALVRRYMRMEAEGLKARAEQ